MKNSSTLIVMVLSVAVASAAANPPKIVPFPSAPPGPKIRRVTHDALKPVAPGARVVVTVLTEPKIKVTAELGAILAGISCSPRGGEQGTYYCEAVVPESGAGPQRVKITATDSKGRYSSLSAPLPVVVEKLDPWSEPNALNVRLAPALFADGSSELDAAARADLAKDAESVKTHLDLPVVIEGHCDPGESGDLDALSLRRAEAARDHLAAIGVSKERMILRAMASGQPVGAPNDAETRTMNRRAMVLFEPRQPAGPGAPKPDLWKP